MPPSLQWNALPYWRNPAASGRLGFPFDIRPVSKRDSECRQIVRLQCRRAIMSQSRATLLPSPLPLVARLLLLLLLVRQSVGAGRVGTDRRSSLGSLLGPARTRDIGSVRSGPGFITTHVDSFITGPRHAQDGEWRHRKATRARRCALFHHAEKVLPSTSLSLRLG